MSKYKGTKKRKGSKKTQEPPREQYLPLQRHQDDGTVTEPNIENETETETEETQEVLNELCEQHQVHAEPSVENHGARLLFSKRMFYYLLGFFLLMLVIFAFLSYGIISVDNKETFLFWLIILKITGIAFIASWLNQLFECNFQLAV
ncbi:unnamed protein product [Larinioides sclopetarius]|uniref:Uncharacterized protein n=1 Tax=Larinioides sclopetarius TaxID=280406 RepID=A0AAV2B299_9ARAC